VPDPEFRVIRLHTRYRRDLTDERTREKNRAEKLLESAQLTELPDAAAAQEATRPCGRSSRCPKHPDCQAAAAISPA
jgi:hypothetical protein